MGDEIGRRRKVEWRWRLETVNWDLFGPLLAWLFGAALPLLAWTLQPERLAQWTTGRWVFTTIATLPDLTVVIAFFSWLLIRALSCLYDHRPIRIVHTYPDLRETEKLDD